MDFTQEELANEIWKPVVGFEKNYKVSNLGRIYSVKNNKIMAFYDHHGYCRLKLYDKKHKDLAVHRIVAFAFIPNPNNLPFINHIDLNPKNNRVDNLEWCTAKYNSVYSNTKPVAQYTKKGELVAIYISAAEASIQTGIDSASIGCVVCGIKGNTAGGFIWRFTDKSKVNVNNPTYFTGLPYKRMYKDSRRPVRKYTKEGVMVKEYNSISEANKDTLKTSIGSISGACIGRFKSAGGFYWAYSHDTEKIKEITQKEKK